ncbi:DUF389 domain-containing protein [Candidatus Binatia bacterium]|nr:DUF389 domain-containing protein [Candidatus Binatia bacterium]
MAEADRAGTAGERRKEPPARDPGSPDVRARGAWITAWLDAIRGLGSVSPERRTRILDEITIGSQPTATYYVLLGISELIAGFALIIDSDATLIGANVVAPLMTPIFGVSLGLMRGDFRLLRKAIAAEFGGALFGVLLCVLLGLMPFAGEPSAALLAQTRPTLIDLFVAALAGFAGVLALIDERVSPVLPGVAIATALNPPIAALGLCLASGAYAGAWGAFLLFFANVLAILAVAAVLFLIAGFVTRAEIGSVRGLARRFAGAVIGLVLVAGLLTNYLIGLVENMRTQQAIQSVLDESLSHEPNTALVSVDFSRGKSGIDVLSTITTPRVVDPQLVQRVQDALASRLGEPVRLYLRCSVTQDVSATGSTSIRPYLSLNGRVTEAPLSSSMRLLQQAEQVAREVAPTRPDIRLQNIELVELESGPVFVISIESSRTPNADDVARFETVLRERLGEPRLHVVVRKTLTTDVTAKGRILLGSAHFGGTDAAGLARRDAVEQAVRDAVQATPDRFAAAVDAVERDGAWKVRAEVVGPRLPTPAEIRAIDERVSAQVGERVELSVWARAEVQVDAQRYAPLGD